MSTAAKKVELFFESKKFLRELGQKNSDEM